MCKISGTWSTPFTHFSVCDGVWWWRLPSCIRRSWRWTSYLREWVKKNIVSQRSCDRLFHLRYANTLLPYRLPRSKLNNRFGYLAGLAFFSTSLRCSQSVTAHMLVVFMSFSPTCVPARPTGFQFFCSFVFRHSGRYCRDDTCEYCQIFLRPLSYSWSQGPLLQRLEPIFQTHCCHFLSLSNERVRLSHGPSFSLMEYVKSPFMKVGSPSPKISCCSTRLHS